MSLPNSILNYQWECLPYDQYTNLYDLLHSYYNASTQIKDYWPILNLENGIELLMNHIQNKNKILIFGDYDVDGICGSVILSKFLKYYNANYEVIIPNRFSHGYGLNVNFIDSLNDIALLITIDNGTTAINEIALARKKNIDVLIIDHHTPAENIPNANFIMNPKLFNHQELYDLCGAGVTFVFLVEALRYCKKNALPVYLELYDLLDLVALATICDVVSLTQLNRALVAQGLKLIRDKKSYWSELLLSNIVNIDTETLGFSIGPYINASGRFGDSISAFEFLHSTNRMEQITLLAKLYIHNDNRKKQENEIMSEIIPLLQNNNDKVFIYASEKWPEGLLGILSARIKDILNVPVILFTQVNENQYKGSGRSFEYFHLGHCIQAAKHLIVTGGGHCMAGGLTINIDNFDIFKKFVLEYYEQNNTLLNSYNKKFHTYLSLEGMQNAYEQVIKFEPYGANFTKPLFCFSNVSIEFLTFIKNQHGLFRVFNNYNNSNTTFIIFNIARTKFIQLTYNRIIYGHVIGHIQMYNNKISIQVVDVINNIT